MKSISIQTPLTDDTISMLAAGMMVLISGVIYTARDAAHKRLCESIKNGVSLPFDPRGQIFYYAGPAPARPGMTIGSIGPTTSSRMDAYTPLLIEEAGLRGMIGKGDRNQSVVDAIKRFKCVYFAATGGAGALLSGHVVHSSIVCYEDLATEAIRELIVKDFPVFVAIDSYGNP
jgi:fumarate hydratase subunit beta